MTDLELFILMYKGFGIDLDIESGNEHTVHLANKNNTHSNLESIHGAISAVDFDSEGQFIKQCFYAV